MFKFHSDDKELVALYTNRCVQYLSGSQLNHVAGHSLLLRNIASLFMTLLAEESTLEVLCDTFKQSDKHNISTVADILVYLLELKDDDITGEILTNKEVLAIMTFNEESIERFIDLMLTVDVIEHRFAKVYILSFPRLNIYTQPAKLQKKQCGRVYF